MSYIEARDGETNYERAFAHRPAVYEAWQDLGAALKANMDLRLYELVTLAAARRLRSSYCSLAHGRILAERIIGSESLRDLVTGGTGGLSEGELAAMALAEKVVDDATSVTGADIQHLRDLGYTEAQVFDIVAAAALRCFFSKTLDGLGVLPDASFAGLEPALRDRLVVGRPIDGT